MSKFNQLKKSLVNHPTDNFENNSQTDYEFSNYSLEELRAKGDELWERSRQQDPYYYHKLNQWLKSKSLDE